MQKLYIFIGIRTEIVEIKERSYAKKVERNYKSMGYNIFIGLSLKLLFDY